MTQVHSSHLAGGGGLTTSTTAKVGKSRVVCRSQSPLIIFSVLLMRICPQSLNLLTLLAILVLQHLGGFKFVHFLVHRGYFSVRSPRQSRLFHGVFRCLYPGFRRNVTSTYISSTIMSCYSVTGRKRSKAGCRFRMEEERVGDRDLAFALTLSPLTD